MQSPIKTSLFFCVLLFVVWQHTQTHVPELGSKLSSGVASVFYGITTLDFILPPRDVLSYWITKNFGLPTTQVLHLFQLYPLMLLEQLFGCHDLLLCTSSVKDDNLDSFDTAFRRILIILLLLISGNVHPNPGPAFDTTSSQLLFNDFCDRKSLGFLHVNICSLLNSRHFDNLKTLVHTSNPDVLAISESWLKKSNTDLDILLPGYIVFRQDRSTRGGGVAMYVKDHLHCTVAFSKSVPKQFELLVVKLKLSTNFVLTVAVCYRAPSAPALSLTVLSEFLAPFITSEFVLLGDLNWDMLNPPDIVQQQFDALNLSQIISESTRPNLKSPSSSTLLDLILTNTPSNYQSGVFSQISDRCAIACIRSGTSVKRPPVIVTKRSLRKLDMQAFVQDVAAVPWDIINSIHSLDNAWSYFKKTFSMLIDKHAPMKRFRIKNRYSPWFSQDLAVFIHKKNTIWRKARSTQSPADWLAFKQCRNKATQAIRNAKISHFREKFNTCGSDARKFWNTVKSMENKLNSPHLPSSMIFNNIVINDKHQMALLLNHHFINSTKAFTTSNSVTTFQPPSSSNSGFSFKSISVSEVLEELTKLNPNKSAGYDGLDPMFLKASAHVIAAPITKIFNLSLHLSAFPLDWKSALIFPLFKGGSGSDPDCYQPISILPCLAKVMERLVHKQLSYFLASNNILSDFQSGFRAGYGCMTAVTKVLDDIITALDSKKTCIAAFIDLAKAFDSVDHRVLLSRLSSIGLSTSCCDWFASYLVGRVQQLKTENFLSEPLAIFKGVPQGSILGPTLFSIYINDVAKAAGNSHIHLYADDTILYSFGPSLHSAASTLQRSLTSIEQSFQNLHLRLNTNKTKCIIFGLKNDATNPPKISCANGTALEYVNVYKYLGIWLDSSLSFTTHINNLQMKVRSRLAFLFPLSLMLLNTLLSR
uniref:Reverse transcriptase domain-containing protein n=1 Tax=Astyanax mexicanus TaxID=7994 RepID=A0A3B1JMQ8_ASTMX